MKSDEVLGHTYAERKNSKGFANFFSTTVNAQRKQNYQKLSMTRYLNILISNSHPNDLPFFKGQFLISCIWVRGHGQRIVVKESHKDPEGFFRL